MTDIDLNKQSKYVIISEFNPDFFKNDLLQDKGKLNYWDVLCLIYNGTEDSFKYITEIKEQLPKEIAKVLIKISDQESVAGNIPTEEIANELKTSQYKEILPIGREEEEEQVSFLNTILGSKEALEMIALTALFPSKGVENSLVESLREEETSKNQQKYLVFFSSAAIAIGGALYFGGKPALEYIKKFMK